VAARAPAGNAVDQRFVTETLTRLVRTNSINPAFSGSTSNESTIADLVSRMLTDLGMTVARYEPEPGRASVVGRLAGTGGGRSLMLYAHYDTVGVAGMPDPFSAAVRDGRLYGRGAYDMKGSLAACLGAVKALRDAGVRLAGDLLIAGVADEEVASIGMEDVLRHVRPDAAIVTEPTELALCLAHKGFAWIDVTVHGRAAHGSRYDLGVDANIRMGRFLAALEALERALRARTPHPLTGPPSLHVGRVEGGSGDSTYAERAVASIERRTVPGERVEDVVAEVQGIVDALAAADPAFRADVRLRLARPGFELPADAPVARGLRAAAADLRGAPPPEVGVAYWMDAALLAAAGIETAVIGPVGAGAHAAEEWVDLESLGRLAAILARAAVEVCGAA
jgi:acetylornithine deacetylase